MPSAAEFDNARAEHARAQAAVNTAAAAVAQARAQLSSDETQSSKAVIRSPVTGVVLSRQVDPGQTVAASLNAPVLFVIAEDLKRMRLEVKVDEADVGQVSAGQTATFQVDAFPGRTFPANVERVDLGANASDGSSSSSAASTASGTVVAYTAVLAVDNSARHPAPGHDRHRRDRHQRKTQRAVGAERGAAIFAGRRRRAANQGGGVTSVLIPQRPRGTGSSQSRRDDRPWQHADGLLLGQDGEPEAVPVTTGDTNGTQTEVTGKGLEKAHWSSPVNWRRTRCRRDRVQGVAWPLNSQLALEPRDPAARRDEDVRRGRSGVPGAARRRPRHGRGRFRRRDGRLAARASRR